MGRRSISVFLAEDQHVVRRALRAYLERAPDIEFMGEASDGITLQESLVEHQPDVLIMDVQMPNHDPVETVTWLREEYPELKILALSAHRSPQYIVDLYQAGAAGYMLKDDPSEDLVGAVRRIASGREYISPQAATVLVHHLRGTGNNRISQLTDREKEVLVLMAHGYRNDAIAEQLFISEHTVRNHITHIFSKLDVDNRVEAVTMALAAKLVTLTELQDKSEE